jgi:hypothetical protein
MALNRRSLSLRERMVFANARSSAATVILAGREVLKETGASRMLSKTVDVDRLEGILP